MAFSNLRTKFTSSRLSRMLTGWRQPLDPERSYRLAQARQNKAQMRTEMARLNKR